MLRRIITSVGLLLITVCAFGMSEASLKKTQYWEDFRKALPNPFQTIGFASFADGSQLYIISEPPESITLSQIEVVFEGLIYESEVKQWEYGADGWVKDLLVTVDYAPEGCEEFIIAWLNKLLYGYGGQAIYTRLPLERPRELFLKDNLDIKVSAESLYAWFMEDNMPLEDFSGRKYSFKDALFLGREAVYRSVTPGFVVWTLPVNASISMQDKCIRQFTLNSDMIIGAIASNKVLCILGRERELDLLDVPPLRTEEVCMLAWAPERLSQSLDVWSIVFGIFKDNLEWCPAYLSKELENTETGHLMTITDIFLKLWLVNVGQCDGYLYPRPPSHFNEDLIAKASTIRFNWNTDGVYSKTNYGDCSVFSIRNTACLNASLFDSSEITEKNLSDKTANTYLASLNNVDFFRVAQYFVLFEMFKTYGIICRSYKMPPTTEKSRLLFPDAQDVIRRIRYLDNNEKEKAVLAIAEDEFNNDAEIRDSFWPELEKTKQNWEGGFKKSMEKKASEAGLSYDEYIHTESYKEYRDVFKAKWDGFYKERYNELRNAVINTISLSVKKAIDNLQESFNSIPNNELDGFAQYSANHHGYYSQEKFRHYKLYESRIMGLLGVLWRYGRFLGIDFESIKDRYQNNLLHDAGFWHKTPKTMISGNFIGTKTRPDGRVTIGSQIGGHSITVNVQTGAPKTKHLAPVQDKSSVVQRSYPKYDDPLLGAVIESNKAAILSDKGDPVASMVQARNALWVAAGPIKERTTDIVLYNRVNSAVRAAIEKQIRADEEAAREKEIKKQRQKKIEEIENNKKLVIQSSKSIIKKLYKNRKFRERYAPVIQKLELQVTYFTNVDVSKFKDVKQNPSVEETANRVNDITVDKPQIQEETIVIPQTENIEEADEMLLDELARLKQKIAMAKQTIANIEQMIAELEVEENDEITQKE